MAAADKVIIKISYEQKLLADTLSKTSIFSIYSYQITVKVQP